MSVGFDSTSNSAAVLKADLLKLLPNLRAFAISLCSNDSEADDLVQDTLIKAWEHQDKFEIGTNLRGWLFTILRNTYFSRYRRRWREVADPDGFHSAGLPLAANQEFNAELQDVRAALAQLPPDQREALLHVGMLGHSYEETAEIVGCAVGTIKSRVSRARTRLCQLLYIEAEGAGSVETKLAG